jgi:hypothetical protein
MRNGHAFAAGALTKFESEGQDGADPLGLVEEWLRGLAPRARSA